MNVPTLPATSKERVTDVVHRTLRDLIVSRQFAPGQKITTEDLAKRLGVSRSPVHEALVNLSSEGLVEIVPRRGTFVTELSLADVAETMDVRRALEVLASESAVRHVTDTDVEVLLRLADEIERTPAAIPDPQTGEGRHSARNLTFHQTLVELSRNQVLVDMYQRLNAHLKMARAHIYTWRDRLREEREEHDAIITALAARDSEALKAAVDYHLRRSTTSLLQDLANAADGDS